MFSEIFIFHFIDFIVFISVLCDKGDRKAGNARGFFMTIVLFADEAAKLTECTHTAYFLMIVLADET